MVEEGSMHSVYKWLIGGVSALLMMFMLSYMDSVRIQAQSANDVLLNHRERIATLEEATRNSQQLLQEIRTTLYEVNRALASSNYRTNSQTR